MSTKCWLMKAEPDSRIVKGKDVKFSVDDFEAAKTTAWEGVRNAEARNLMKEMAVGDQVLFYHSNCKTPGIAAIAEVSKEAYPDYTAWDSEHPYYDEKTVQEKPKWYMVDVSFRTRLTHFIPLSLLKSMASSSDDDPDDALRYIGVDGVKAIKSMALVTRGRLSVQRVERETFDVLVQMGERGGWEENSGKAPKAGKAAGSKKAVTRKKARSTKNDEGDDHAVDVQEQEATTNVPASGPSKPARGRKRNLAAVAAVADEELDVEKPAVRRSTRSRR